MQLKDNLVRTVQFNTKTQCVYMLAGAHAHSYTLLLLLHCVRLHYWGTFSPNAHTMHLEYSNTFNWFYPNIYVSKQKDDCKQIETMFLLLRCFVFISSMSLDLHWVFGYLQSKCDEAQIFAIPVNVVLESRRRQKMFRFYCLYDFAMGGYFGVGISIVFGDIMWFIRALAGIRQI